MHLVCHALMLLAATTLARADEAPKDKTPAVVPFEMLATRHLAVKIKINGKGPYRVIFDTGAPVSLIDTKIAKEAGVIGEKVKPGFFGMAGEQKVEKLELGELKVENIRVIVMDHPALTAVTKVLGPVDGILGFPFFARFRMTLDYQAMQLTFIPTGYQPADVMANLALTLMSTNNKPAKKVLAATGIWGLVVDKDAKDEESGITIKQVLPESPAANAGLKAGDRLLVVDGTWTESVEDCFRAAKGVPPGRSAQVRYARGGKEIESTIKPNEGI